MRRSMNKVALLGALALVATAFPMVNASAQTTYDIEIGEPLGPEIRTAESMRFFPSSITVHQGDSLHFTTRRFHTATLLPVGESAQDWIDENAATRDDPWSHFQNDPDDGPGDLKENVNVFISNRTDCGPGAGGTTPCDFDGTSVLNSGVPFEEALDFTAIVDVAPGNSFWVICLIHPHMRMKVTVVDGGTPATTQESIDADKAAKVALDTDWALATDRKYEAKRTKHKTAGGRPVWDVWQGVDSHWVSLAETYPKRVNIRRGQTVRWHFGSLIYETHSATFPLDEGLWFGQIETFNLVCDPDGDAGPGPDTPADFNDPQLCPGGISQVEIDFEARSAQGTGNGVVRNVAPENSGIRGVATNRFDSYDVRFRKASGDRPYTFFCFFHGPQMFTRINVRG
jgi:plastocyanin